MIFRSDFLLPSRLLANMAGKVVMVSEARIEITAAVTRSSIRVTPFFLVVFDWFNEIDEIRLEAILV